MKINTIFNTSLLLESMNIKYDDPINWMRTDNNFFVDIKPNGRDVRILLQLKNYGNYALVLNVAFGIYDSSKSESLNTDYTDTYDGMVVLSQISDVAQPKILEVVRDYDNPFITLLAELKASPKSKKKNALEQGQSTRLSVYGKLAKRFLPNNYVEYPQIKDTSSNVKLRVYGPKNVSEIKLKTFKTALDQSTRRKL